MPFKWVTAAVTDRGIKRKINEDAILVCKEKCMWVAADGMGGHEAGDMASKMVIDALDELKASDRFSKYVDDVERVLMDANEKIRDYSANMFGGRMMGCTVVTFLVHDTIGACLWAGDSRLYRMRKGRLEQLSKDHSQAQEMVDSGAISQEEANNIPDSNVITRAVGGAPVLNLDVILFDVEDDDIYLLCSDGLYGELSHREIEDRLGEDVQSSVDELLALTLGKGAKDNVSIIAAHAIQG